MSKIAAFLSGVAGVLVLAGYFVPAWNQAYYIVPAGGALAILSAFINHSRPLNRMV